MNRKRNISYIKPEDPHFLKILKKQAGYDDRNHKFDELENSEEDFVDDTDTEQPQVVVLKQGDLTAEEAKIEIERLKKEESEAKADLSQKVIFKAKSKENNSTSDKKQSKKVDRKEVKNKKQLLSFADEDDTDE
ncbi:uncharacterized protein KIAA1143 homolog [Epargyreus clarus]|uniref:uncharacterized protein KIAA1143 homolog n=1 Tax=Epargyreus clarus TaxID=520877 RepID=UPI003C2B6221